MQIVRLSNLLYATALMLNGPALYAATYCKHTIDLTPVIFGLANYPIGFNSNDSRIDGFPFSAFKSAHGYFVTDVEKMINGYSGELGYFLCDNVQLKTRISYTEDRALGAPLNINDRSYEFLSRDSWTVSLGMDRYFDIKSEHWIPFVGIMGGVMLQKSTNAVLYETDEDSNILGTLGVGTLESAKNRFKGSLMAGVDYRFNLRWAVGFTSALSYLARPLETQGILFSNPTAYKDNSRSFTLQMYFSIRNLIPPSCQTKTSAPDLSTKSEQPPSTKPELKSTDNKTEALSSKSTSESTSEKTKTSEKTEPNQKAETTQAVAPLEPAKQEESPGVSLIKEFLASTESADPAPNEQEPKINETDKK